MSHDYHDVLPGFHESQILHDGCRECEYRGEHPERAISALDTENFERAWYRAEEWHRHGLKNISDAERPLLEVFWSIQCQLERHGIPLGRLPRSSMVSL